MKDTGGGAWCDPAQYLMGAAGSQLPAKPEAVQRANNVPAGLVSLIFKHDVGTTTR